MAGLSSLFLCQKLVYLIHAVAVYLRPLLNFIGTNIFCRVKVHVNNLLNKNDKKINYLEAEPELSPEQKDDTESMNFGGRDEEEEKPKEIYLKFKFPTYEEFSKIQNGTGNNSNIIFNTEVVPSGFTEFTSGKSFISAFIDELETFPVKKEIDDGDDDRIVNPCNNEEGFPETKFGGDLYQTGGVHDKGKGILVVDGGEGEKNGAKVEFTESSGKKGQTIQGKNEFIDECQFSSNENYVITDSDSETSFEYLSSAVNRLVDSHDDGFLSDGDFGEELDNDRENEKMETGSELWSGFEGNHDSSSEDISDEDSDIMEELKNLEEHNNVRTPDVKNSGFLSERDFKENSAAAGFVINYEKGANEGNNSIEKRRSKEDENELESLWEHQELIEQLKMELKKVRATGLPTILEESESPKLMDGLRPWKIDEFQRGNSLGELHKFYKSYRERMRKFDIINYQKMYAMGFLQLKDPLKSTSMQKPSPPTLRSLVSQNLWLFKHKIHGTDPMKKFVQELQGDLEGVYVGQMCLSWEFLFWQYDKVLDLWDSDPRGLRRYNEVAGEFQQFQVLLQRFVEDEPFQGPRVQNYVKTRCAVRNLLQVPVVREDNLKDKRKARAKATNDYVITSDMLVETVEESIRIFWRFVRADKDCTIAAINGHNKLPELPSPEDLTLLMEVKKILQKKERKLKDILRSDKNCILRKFRQCREDDADDQVLYFFSQVDMKLVCRVLNMSKVTKEQLMWCRNKLDRISFVNRRIHVEPAFLLFPC